MCHLINGQLQRMLVYKMILKDSGITFISHTVLNRKRHLVLLNFQMVKREKLALMYYTQLQRESELWLVVRMETDSQVLMELFNRSTLVINLEHSCKDLMDLIKFMTQDQFHQWFTNHVKCIQYRISQKEEMRCQIWDLLTNTH